jgi:hypothetical protein
MGKEMDFCARSLKFTISLIQCPSFFVPFPSYDKGKNFVNVRSPCKVIDPLCQPPSSHLIIRIMESI